MKSLEVRVYPGAIISGLWCYQCHLPSAFHVTVHIGSPKSATTVAIRQCSDDQTHVLIDGPEDES